MAARTYDVEELVFGSAGEGSEGTGEEIVLEILVRGGDSGDGVAGRRKRGIERTLEGWHVSKRAACELQGLSCLKTLFMTNAGSAEVTRTVS